MENLPRLNSLNTYSELLDQMHLAYDHRMAESSRVKYLGQ